MSNYRPCDSRQSPDSPRPWFPARAHCTHPFVIAPRHTSIAVVDARSSISSTPSVRTSAPTRPPSTIGTFLVRRLYSNPPPCPITLFPAIAFCHRCNQLPIIAINARILLATGARDIEFPHKLSPSQPLLPYPAIIIQRIDDSPRPVPWHSNAIPAQRTVTLSYARAPASPFLGFRRHHRHPRLDSSHPLIRPNPQCS